MLNLTAKDAKNAKGSEKRLREGYPPVMCAKLTAGRPSK